MRRITSEEAVSILDYFEDLEDPRSAINRKHLLGDLIVICICGVLAGADGPKAIGVWAKANSDWLSTASAAASGHSIARYDWKIACDAQAGCLSVLL